jgi:hypothetical protein
LHKMQKRYPQLCSDIKLFIAFPSDTNTLTKNSILNG